MFPSEAEADANDTSNALRIADDILGVAGTGAKITPMTLAEAVANTSAAAGQIVQITDRGDGQFTYLTGQTPNTFNIVAADKATLDLVLRLEDEVDITQLGAVTGQSDGGAIQHAISLGLKVIIPEGIFTIDNTLTITDTRVSIKGVHASFAGQILPTVIGGSKSIIKCDPSLTGYAIEVEAEFAGSTLEDLGIDGNQSNADGAIYLKQLPSQLNNSNTIKNCRLYSFPKLGAVGLNIEAWGTNADNVWIRDITSGTGIRMGAGGTTGTTQLLNRCYIGEVDTGIRVQATSLGVAIENCIIESTTLGISVASNGVTVINQYFENMCRDNQDNTGPFSLIYNSTIGSLDPQEGLIFAEGTLAANVNVFGGQSGVLSGDASGIKFTASLNSSINISGFEIDSGVVKSEMFIEQSSGTITVSNPRYHKDQSYIESLRDVTFFSSTLQDSEETGFITGRSGVIETSNDQFIYNEVSRKAGDTHISTIKTEKKLANTEVVTRDNSTTVSTPVSSGTSIDVADGTGIAAGDFCSIRIDDGSFMYTSVVSVTVNAIVITDTITDSILNGAAFNSWKWSNGAEFTRYSEASISLATSASGNALETLNFSSNNLIKVEVAYTSNSKLRAIDILYIEHINGVSSPELDVVSVFAGSYTQSTYAVTANDFGLFDLNITSNSSLTMEIVAKVTEGFLF